METSVAMNCLGEERKMTTWVWKNRTPADDGWTDGRTDGRGRPGTCRERFDGIRKTKRKKR